MKSKIYRYFTALALVLFVLLILGGGTYAWWNNADPGKTCISCHEINAAHNRWAQSAHRNITCSGCHGTALGNGWHSLSEKSMMVFSHVRNKPHADDIQLNEDQVLETMERCAACHQSEYAAWKAGGHSVTYGHILLNETQNQAEQLNHDCLRCHGMFYEGIINDLVEPVSTTGPWRMKDESRSDKPMIPCLTCHQIHSSGEPSAQPDYSIPNNIFYSRNLQNNSLGFYNRHEKMHFTLNDLPHPVMLTGRDTLTTTSDKVYRLCVQCHAPSVWHQAGSSDDRTPSGVHEGLSCRACHEPHSNNQRNACDKCHPAQSANCRLDVRTMNTTYFSPSSPNDIHFVSCNHCHPDMKRNKETNQIKAGVNLKETPHKPRI